MVSVRWLPFNCCWLPASCRRLPANRHRLPSKFVNKKKSCPPKNVLGRGAHARARAHATSPMSIIGVHRCRPCLGEWRVPAGVRTATGEFISCPTRRGLSPAGLCLKGGVGGGGGSGIQKVVHQKWPDQIFPAVNFVVSHDGNFGLGGARGSRVCGFSITSLGAWLPPWRLERVGGTPVVRSVRVRLCTLTFHGYARLRTLTPQHSARLCTLGLGDTEVDLLYSHAQVLCRKKIGAGGIFI